MQTLSGLTTVTRHLAFRTVRLPLLAGPFRFLFTIQDWQRRECSQSCSLVIAAPESAASRLRYLDHIAANIERHAVDVPVNSKGGS